MRVVYLCGGINGLNDAEAKNWREQAKELLTTRGWEWLDPMRRDYRGIEDSHYEEIVAGDLEDIERATDLLVMAVRPSWGTAMETWLAAQMNKSIRVVVGPGQVSPWLRFCATSLHTTLEDAIEAIDND